MLTQTRGSVRRIHIWWIVVAILSATQLLFRLWSVLGLANYHDDIDVTYRVLETEPGPGFLNLRYSGHWGPVTRVIEWIGVHPAPFNPGWQFAVVLLLLVGADVAMLLAVRVLFGFRLTGVAVYALWLFTPVIATSVGSWSLGVLQIPLAGLMALAVAAHAYAMKRKGMGKIAVSAGALAAALLVSPLALFLVPFIVLFTIAYPNWSDRQAGGLRSHLKLLGVELVVVVAYLAIYFSSPGGRPLQPLTWESAGQVGSTLMVNLGVASFLGGPWAADSGALPSVPLVEPVVMLVLLQVLAVIVGASLVMRRHAWRAWAAMSVLVIVYVPFLAVALPYEAIGEALLRQTRYLVPLLVPGLILLGSAFAFGPERSWLRRIPREGRGRMGLTLMAAAGVVLLCESAMLTNIRIAEAMKESSTATFWNNIRDSFSRSPDAVIVDRNMPDQVLFPGFLPQFGATSKSLRYFVTNQTWNAPSSDLRFITDDGRLVGAKIEPFAQSLPGPVPGCGYPVTSDDWVSIPMNSEAFNYAWGLRLNFLAQAQTTIEVQPSGGGASATVEGGIGNVQWVSAGTISTVKVRLAKPDLPGICVDSVVVGGISGSE